MSYEQVISECRIGQGKQIRTIQDDPILWNAIRPRVDISNLLDKPDLILLTPRKTDYPFVDSPLKMRRSPGSNRAFEWEKEGHSVTVKSADLLYTKGVSIAIRRVINSQF